MAAGCSFCVFSPGVQGSVLSPGTPMLLKTESVDLLQTSVQYYAEFCKYGVQRLHDGRKLFLPGIFPHMADTDDLAFQHVERTGQHQIVIFAERGQNRGSCGSPRYVEDGDRDGPAVSAMKRQPAFGESLPYCLRDPRVAAEDIRACSDLMILAESEEAGVFLCMTKDGRQIYIMGHPEYDRVTLDQEYKRDKAKGLPIELPVNYYPDNDPEKKPLLLWRAHANNLYTNWLNYYVYQTTPYDLDGTPF